jgi:D-ribulokinase
MAYVLGIDIGTQGVRTAIIGADGSMPASTSIAFELTSMAREEQSPLMWWDNTLFALKDTIKKASAHINLHEIKAIATTSTSGTVIPIDINGEPVHNALMYSDKRSKEEGQICRNLAKQHLPNGFTGFNASCGLPKIQWFTKNFPTKVSLIYRWIHAADFITGRLSDIYGVTDFTNALKTGYDVANFVWPDYIIEQLANKHWLQEVVPSGTVLGTLRPSLADLLGIPAIDVVVGLTDGCASQMASGAIKPGDWNTTIGTTLVIKGVTEKAIMDPTGSIYNHRHPEGFWMPGGASNTGADWVSIDFDSNELAFLNAQASKLIPTPYLAWPLKQEGERFPFVAPNARGFAPTNLSKTALYTANMEGVAYVERLAYELIEKLSSEQVKSIYTAGGGSNSDTWLRIRSAVLNKPIYRCKEASGVLGAAICAASNTIYRSVSEAVGNMTSVAFETIPDEELTQRYAENYHKFIKELIIKGYLTSC